MQAEDTITAAKNELEMQVALVFFSPDIRIADLGVVRLHFVEGLLFLGSFRGVLFGFRGWFSFFRPQL